MSRTISLRGMLLLATLATTTANAQPATDKRAGVKAILDAWQAQRTQFPYLRYTAKGVETIPRGISTHSSDGKPLPVPLPTEDKTFPVDLSLLLDTKRDRYRLERNALEYDIETDTPRRFPIVIGFDGEQNWVTIPRGGYRPQEGEELDAATVSGNLRGVTLTADIQGVFLSHGYVTIHHHRRMPGKFQPTLDPDEFYLHGTGKYQGVVCTIVRTELDHSGGESYHEYWVDPQRGGLILRSLRFVGNELRDETAIDYKKQGNDWLLAGWSFLGRYRGKLQRSLRFKVEVAETALQPSESEFQLALKPGMKVRRTVYGGHPSSATHPPTQSERFYVVNAAGLLVPVDGSSWATGWVWWAVAAGVIFALAVLCLLWYRRSRSVQ